MPKEVKGEKTIIYALDSDVDIISELELLEMHDIRCVSLKSVLQGQNKLPPCEILPGLFANEVMITEHDAVLWAPSPLERMDLFEELVRIGHSKVRILLAVTSDTEDKFSGHATHLIGLFDNDSEEILRILS